MPVIGSIQISLEFHINESNNLTQKQIWKYHYPVVISPLQWELKSWHEELSHLYINYMLRLEIFWVPTSIFLYLKEDVSLCTSWIFGTERILQWTTKGNKSRYKSKESNNKIGSAVSVDQRQSAQTGLLPQFPGKITNERICAVQVMVDHFIDLTHVHIMKRKNQEEKLE